MMASSTSRACTSSAQSTTSACHRRRSPARTGSPAPQGDVAGQHALHPHPGRGGDEPGEPRLASPGQGQGQDPRQGLAIGPWRAIAGRQTVPLQQSVDRGLRHPMSSPVDVRQRAGPRQVFQGREQRFEERAVDRGVVRHHEVGHGEQFVDSLAIEVTPLEIAPAQPRDRFRRRAHAARLPPLAGVSDHAQDESARAIHTQAQDGQADDLVRAGIQARRLGVDDRDVHRGGRKPFIGWRGVHVVPVAVSAAG